MDYNKTGDLIASLRKEKGLTQKDIADKLGITDRAVSKWERGLGCPDISLLDDLSRILDISILEILKGRKLDKDEIVNNESMIESMNYSKENLKYKFKKYFNLVSISIIIIISLMIIISNIKSIYYFNKTYHYDLYDDSDISLFTEINNNIEKIKSSQGIYSDEDYRKIINFINILRSNLDKQNNLYYYTKDNYTYYEILKFYDIHQEYNYFLNPSKLTDTVFGVVHKYDSSIINDISIYYIYNSTISNYITQISEQLEAPYYGDKEIANEIIVNIKGFIYFESLRDNILLKNIIKVGEINE